MKNIFILTFILLLQFTAFSQVVQWQYHSYHHINQNEDKAYAVTQTIDGGYVFAGRYGTNGLNNGDIYFARLDSAGILVWQKIYSGSSGDEVRSIKQLADGSLIASGFTWDFGDTSGNYYKNILMKLDSSGDTLWTKRFGSPGVIIGEGLGSSVDTTDDGGFVLVGKYINGINGNDFYVVKTNANGDSLWTKLYGGSGSDIPRAVRITSDGGFIIAGTTKSFGVNPAMGNMWLIKTNSSGDTMWTKTFGGTGAEDCYSVRQTKDGGYIMAGRTGNDIYVVKADSNGIQQWAKSYPLAGPNDAGRDIIQTSDGGYALAGLRTATHGYYLLYPQLMYVLKLNNAGVQQWEKELGYDNTPNGAAGYAIQETKDKGLIVAGFNQPDTAATGTEDLRAFIVKFAPLIFTGEKNMLPVTTGCSIYPNPFSETATVSLVQAIQGEKFFDLYNLTGQKLWSKRIGEDETRILINRNKLESGIYFYELKSTQSNHKYRGKIIVQ